ncbi:MAG: type II secretion system F family protein [Tepidimonas sp.]|nr:type II secretion system F family protein [Tepidimonas sp.]
MPSFHYQALDTHGRRQRGHVTAEHARAARAQLRAQGLIPLQVTAAESRQMRRWSTAQLAAWTRQLAALVDSGLPLERALAELERESDDLQQAALTAALRAEVNAGSSLASALQRHAHVFDAPYRAVVAAGETSGRLGEVLQRLADEREAAEALRHKVLSAALYPAIVTVFALTIVVFLMTYVVPQVAQAFASGKRALPTLTVLVLHASQGLRSGGWLVLPLAALAWGGWTLLRRRPSSRLALDRAWLKLPLLGRLARQLDLARLAATLALLVQAGVPLLRALATAADTLRNTALQHDVRAALALVREGAPLAAALATRPALAGLLVTFARLGEHTGQLGPMLQRAAQQLADDAQRRILRLTTWLEPLLIIALGAIVLLIVLAVMLPIIQLNQLVR